MMYQYRQNYTGLKIIAAILIVITAIGTGTYLTANNITPVMAASQDYTVAKEAPAPIPAQDSDTKNDVGVFHYKDIVATAILPEEEYVAGKFFTVEQYAANCQTMKSYSSNPIVRAILSTKQYVSGEEIPILENIVSSSTNINTTLAEMAPNVTVKKPFSHEWAKMIQDIAASCQ